MTRLRKSLTVGSMIVLLLFLLSLYNAAVVHVREGGKALGPLTAPVRWMSEFPSTAMSVLRSKEIKGIPLTYQEMDTAFAEVNLLDYDLLGLNAFYQTDSRSWIIRLFNLATDSVLHEWDLEKHVYKNLESEFRDNPPINCILLPDRGLILPFNKMFRLDRDAKIVWMNPEYVHHGMNLGPDGHIWTCSGGQRGVYDPAGAVYSYVDDRISKIDINTGQLLYQKSIAALLIENGYPNFVFGMANVGPELKVGDDPIHLNDVQPVMSDGPYWRRGDVFLSLRHKSLVILYRPATNEIIRMIHGPFLYQHDVDILTDSTISIFNNNVSIPNENYINPVDISRDIQLDTLFRSEVIIYNMKDRTFRTYLKDRFMEEGIVTISEGLSEFLSNGDLFVESQNQAKLFIFGKEDVLLRKQFRTGLAKQVEQPHWVRIYENDIN